MRHNKKRNSALLYEFLVRHASRCLIDSRKDEAKKVVDISKKYFSKGAPLFDELSLFNNLLKTRVKSRESAQRVLTSVYNHAERSNARLLDAEKSRLIKEINYTFKDEEFYDYKIPDYTVYASIQTLLNEVRSKKKALTDVEKIKLEDSITEHLVQAEGETKPNLTVNPNYNNAVYKFVVERFHKKYDGKLSETQKKLLTKYAVYLISENKDSFKKELQKEVDIVKTKLKTVTDPAIRNDKDLSQKLTECYKKFVSSNFESIDDNTVLEILQYMKLVEEVES